MSAPAGRSRELAISMAVAKTASCGAIRMGTPTSGAPTAREALRAKTWASSPPAGRSKEPGISTAAARTASCGAIRMGTPTSGTPTAREALPAKTWASSAPAGRSREPAISMAVAKTASSGAIRTGTPTSGTPNGSGGFTGEDLGVVASSWQIEGTGDFNGSGKRRHPLAEHERGCLPLELQRLGRLYRPGLGRRRLQLADPRSRRFQWQRKRRHPLAEHERGCRALERQYLGRLHLR